MKSLFRPNDMQAYSENSACRKNQSLIGGKMSKHLRSLNGTMKKVSHSSVSVGIKFAVLILVFAWSLVGMRPVDVSAAGTTYYVDKTNPACTDAGPGTSAIPYCTITKGASMASIPGDTVQVLAGTYAETVFVNYSGVAGSPITFQGSPGVTITGDPAGFGSAFAVSTKSYVVIDGFNITETKYKGIYVDSSNHITISNNHVTYAGINAGYDQHQQGIFIRNTTYSTITGNITDHNSCIGIRLINGSDYNTVSNNISFANSSAIAWPVVAISDAAGIEVTGSNHNLIVNNIVYGNEDTGINLYVNSSGVGSTYNVVVGNLSYSNGDHGIDNNASSYNTIIGNTVHGNGTTGINFEGEVGAGSHHATVMNNIIAGNGLTPPAGSFGGNLRVDANSITGTVLDYNLFNKETATVQIIWNNNNYATLAAFRAVAPTQEVHGLEGNPLFVSPVASVLRTSGEAYPSSTTTGDYHISAGSPAIDSANSDAPNQMSVDIEGYARVDDPATANTGAGTRAYDDRGAYEYQPSGLETPPVVTTQAVTGIAQTSAFGNGNVVSLGVPNPTQHGVVWSTSANPTIADNKTTDGPVSETGAFTSVMTGLVPGTLYHVRAYATNAVATAYGEDVTFTTNPANSVTFTTSGSWVAPAGVNTVTVEVWGGGGRGETISGGFGETVGGGGGGGAYSKKTLTVVPGTSYAYVVGAGSSSTAPGGDSYFINTSTVLAKGGNSATSSSGASGGSAASGVGDVKYSGGSGANGSSSSNYGGGAGSSAGTGSNGNNSTNATGADAPAGGGDGGDGRSGSSGNGSPGSAPGGGGGGAYRSTGFSSYNGGNGARGQVRITYYVSTTPTTTSVNCGAGTPSVAYGSGITCVATVTAASGTTSPSGTVSWSTNGSGAFATSPCTLSGTGGSATCSVTYTPGSVGTGSHLITANYAGSSNFLASSGNQTVTVTKLAASVTPDAATKVYGDVDPALTGTLTGFLPADGVTATYSRVAGETVTGGPYTISATLAPAGVLANYTITYNTADFTITPKAASVTPNAASKVYGAADPALTGTLSGFLPADGVTATYSRVAGETVTGGPYTISATLAPAGVLANYTITYNTADFTITPKGLTIIGVTAQDKTYDRTTAATLNLGGASLVGVIPPDVVTINSSGATGTFASANAGLRAVTASGFGLNGAAGNYVLSAQPTVPSATIHPKPVTANGVKANNKVYDRAANVISFDLSGASLVGVISPDIVSIDSSAASGTFASANAGTWAVTASGFGVTNPNYLLSAQPTVPNATITPKGVTIIGVVAYNKVYDQTTVATFNLAGASLVGVIAPDPVTIDASAATGTFASPNAIQSAVTASGFALAGTGGNYVLSAQPIVPDATIIPRSLTVAGITANDKPYDGNTVAALNLGSAVLQGVLSGDDVTLNTSAAAGTFASANIGTWTVTVSGLTLNGTAKNNYSLTQPTTTASILGATASVTGITANNKVYDGTIAATLDYSGATLVGIVPGDDVTLDTSGAVATFADKNVGTGKVVTISGLALSGPDAGKYVLTQPPASSADITPRDLTVTAVAGDKAYDGTTAATAVLSTDALAGDDVTAAFTAANFDTADVGVGKTVTVEGITIGGLDAGNYTLLNTTATDTADITAAEVTVTADDQTKVTGQPDPVFTYTATGFVGTDTFVTEPVCGVTDPHDAVGTYTITCTGGDAGANYAIVSYVDGVLTVTEVPILKMTFRSIAAQDGWILESTEVSGVGGTLNSTATTFNLGDDSSDRQYRAVLSFNTAGLPDNAIIKSVTLKIRKQGLVGTDPFTTHGSLLAEIRMPYFGTSAGLVVSDFQAAASKTAGLFGITPVSNWYSVIIRTTSFPYINLTGTTQFRLRFQKDDNDDLGADYMKFFSGDYATASARPTLIIEYTLP
jgi:parallel beta-helix repeat protein